MTARLEITDLVVSTKAGDRLVGPIDLAVQPGRALTILGETGAGKSLIAQAILGNLPVALVATGKIMLDGNRIDGLPMVERAALWGRRIALLPQEPWRALDPTMTAGGQVRETHRLVALMKPERAAVATQRDFSDLGLSGAEGKFPGALSGGMAQRVAFAAARAGGAPTLMADEPTKGLDLALRDGVLRMLSATLTDGAGLLTITHDVAVARFLGGDVMFLRSGDVVETGAVDTVFPNPKSEYGRALVAADPALWPEADPPNGDGRIVLESRNLAVERGGHILLDGFDLTLREGERVAITGPSGSGKTSLIDTLAGLLKPQRGSVIRAEGIGRFGLQKLYQDPPAAFAPRIALGTSLRDLAWRHQMPFERLETLMDRLNLSQDLLARRPDEVSGGELQRLALARILSLRPAVILADEPTSRLDPVSQRAVMDVIGQAVKETGAGLILVTHNTEIASKWAHRQVAITPAAMSHPD